VRANEIDAVAPLRWIGRWAVLAFVACGGPRPLGATCTRNSDCFDGGACFRQACVAAPAFTPTFANLNANVFLQSCAVAPCHAPPQPPGGLDLRTNPYSALVGVPASDPGPQSPNPICSPQPAYHYGCMLRVKPGDPENSLLYQKLFAGAAAAPCCLQDAGGCQYGEHMPDVFGEALTPSYLEAVREWILNGAPNAPDAGDAGPPPDAGVCIAGGETGDGGKESDAGCQGWTCI
jgi:hypothetical protein